MLTASKWESVTIQANTPNGPMYVTILDDAEGRPCEIFVHAGKSGGAVHAWAASLSKILSSALKNGQGVNDLIEMLSGSVTSEAPAFQANGSVVRSGPEGVCIALMEYRKIKFRELRATLDGTDGDDDNGYRPPRLVS